MHLQPTICLGDRFLAELTVHPSEPCGESATYKEEITMATSCRTAFAVSHASNSCARLQHRLVLTSLFQASGTALRCPNIHVHWTCTASNAAARKAAVLPAAVPGAAAVSSGAGLPSDFDRSVYLEASSELPHYVGPITVANIPGRGSINHTAVPVTLAIGTWLFQVNNRCCCCLAAVQKICTEPKFL